jgi:hypothetical protein
VILSKSVSDLIIARAYQDLGRSYDLRTFDCVRYVVSVYRDVGIEIPQFGSRGLPPADFHLSAEEFAVKPIGHTVFLRRKANTSDRLWTHMVIIVSPDELIHCSSRFGNKVVVTRWDDLFELYSLAPKYIQT